MARRVRELAFSRRAALRRRGIADIEEPQTTGPESNLASLVWTGSPAGAAAKTVAKFAPRGLKTLATKAAPKLSKWVQRTLKPVLGKSVKR